MKTILDLIVEELKPAFTGCGYDEKYIRSDGIKPPGSLRVSV